VFAHIRPRGMGRERDRDNGFSMVELLVVMVIIGILAAIAIPLFLHQREKATDASVKSDLRTVAAEMEAYFADHQAYLFTSGSTASDPTVLIAPADPGPPPVAVQTVTVSEGSVITAVGLSSATVALAAGTWTAAAGFCLTGVNAKGTSTSGFTYNSLSGGLGSTACP
jgi:type IV pilus assembly protein PilA